MSPPAKTSSSPDPRPNDATRRSCRAASAVASATARAAPLRKRPRLLRTTCSALSRRKSAAAAPTRRFASVGGGGERNRTDDLLLAKQALSQLSYTPSASGEARSPRRRQRLLLSLSKDATARAAPGGLASIRSPELLPAGSPSRSSRMQRPPSPCGLRRDSLLSLRERRLVGQGGFEPPTSRLSSARSNQLSY
jgi:hypothetical protein